METVQSDDILLNNYGSVVRFITDFMEDVREISPDIQFRDIDGHAEDAVLENIDFIFLKDFSGNLETHLQYWTFLIGISTFEDQNMFRHRQIMNELIKRLIPGTTIRLYNHKDLSPLKGSLVVKENLTLNPFSKYNTRAVQFLLVDVASTETTP